MAIKDCIDEIRKLSGEELSDAEVTSIAEEVQRLANRNRARNKLLSQKDALDEAAMEYTDKADKWARNEARNKANNVLKFKALMEFSNTAEARGLKADEQVAAALVGTNVKFLGARDSVDARAMSLTGHYIGGMVADLQRAGVWELLTRRMGLFGRDAGTLDRDIAKASFSIGKDGKVTADVSREAKTVAEIFHKWQEVARLRSNRAGSLIRELPGYVFRQSHNVDEIIKAGRDAWVAFVKPLLDQDLTYGAADPDAFLNGAYAGLSSGVHLKSEGASDNLGFKGPGNLAKQISQERILHFKDAESFLAYNDKFGTKSLIDAVYSGLGRSARDVALMEKFGSNPTAMFDKWRSALGVKYRETRPDWVRRLDQKYLRDQLAEVDGSMQRVSDPTIAKYGSAARALQSMAKLGASTISSLPDIATAASELRWQGQNLGAAYTGLLAEVLQGRGTASSRLITYDIGIGLEGILGDVSARFSGHENLGGLASKTMRLYFKANLLGWWTDSVKSGAGKMMAFRAAQHAARGWNALDTKFRQAIELYGIDEARWEVIRQAKQKGDAGRNYLTPDGVRQLPDSAFASLGGRAQTQRDALSTALQEFYVDRVDYAVLTPGARERAMLHRGLLRGTPEGEAIRFVMQFKSFTGTFLSKAVGREMGGPIFQQMLKGQGDIVGMAQLIGMTTVMGMIAYQAKEVLKGRSPVDPFGPHWSGAWSKAMLQGGGLGIYGDYLLGNFSSYGASPLDTLVGPTFATAADGLKLYSDAIHGATGTGGEAIRFVRDNIPGLNLFYAKAALDYLIIYNLQDWASPGYLRRSERNLKNSTGQTYIVPPTSVLH